MPADLPRNSTLRELKPTLLNAESFVRRVLGVMLREKRTHGPVVIRLGITGTGKAPNYRIEDAGGTAVLAIDGANHEAWSEGAKFEEPENWSSATMSEQDIKDLIGEIRPYSPREPNR